MQFDEVANEEFVRAPNSKEHIDTKIPSYHMLEGEYKSFMIGKSEDYEDLKEYQVGDSVRDIDWRATARMTEPVIRRYKQEKKHDIVFLIDSGKNMLGVTPEHERKQRLALLSAGALMNIALQHQDTIKVFYENNNKILSPNSTTNSSTLNTLLNNINSIKYSKRSNTSTVQKLLSHISGTLKRSSIIVIISDRYTILNAEQELSTLSHRNHILWISIEDCLVANYDTAREYADIQNLETFPKQLRTDRRIVEALAMNLMEQNQKASQMLTNVRSNHATISTEEEIIPSLYKLLHESSLEKPK